MVTVYLDQAEWIDLGKAMHGRPGGERFRSVLDVARHATSQGLVEFPLSRGHYIETWRAADTARRRRLAAIMIELSGGRTLAGPPAMCDDELDAVIAGLTGRPPPTPRTPPLGWGFLHASGMRPDFPRAELDLGLELEQLATRPAGFDEHGRGHRAFGDLYRDGEQGLAEGRKSLPSSQQVREAVLAASAIMEIWENIEWAIERAGLPQEALGPIGRTRPDLPEAEGAQLLDELLPVARGFIARLPTRDAALRLRSARHRNPATKWQSNDMVDIAYLACAVVHCDVVVTERQWVHELRQSGLLDMHRVVALSDVAELPSVLVGLVR